MRKNTILIVDDDEDVLESLRIRFEHKNYDVLTASDGTTVAALVEREFPDLVLMDIHMPTMDGIEVLREIREIDSTVPVIILSGDVSETRAQLAVDEGACGYITKPLDLNFLEKAVADSICNSP